MARDDQISLDEAIKRGAQLPDGTPVPETTTVKDLERHKVSALENGQWWNGVVGITGLVKADYGKVFIKDDGPPLVIYLVQAQGHISHGF